MITKFKDLIGRKIKAVRKRRLKGFDDTGFLQITFTDGSKCIVEGFYWGYTGESEDEYPTDIRLASEARAKKLRK